MDNLKAEPIIIRKLSQADAEIFNNIYTRPDLFWKINVDDNSGNESAEEFTKRMLWMCKYIYTIRLKRDPDKVLGSCVLYNWNKRTKEIYFGGALDPKYWGMGIMPSAFNQMMEMAKYCIGASFIKICVNDDNKQAIRMAEKLGFFNAFKENGLITYMRPIDLPASTAKLINKDRGFQQAI
ncbi:MAG TPA: GNAT family protein [Pseudosphingobacterium sp.]|nr:GNAT family protein [Pseudosphingobacterium sp.]